MKSLKLYSKRALAYSLSGAMALSGPLSAAETDIADGPLAQPATSVKPNMLLIGSGVAAVMVIVASLATVFPARRAATVDPVSVLRSD